MKLVIRLGASADIQEEAKYYEKRQVGLGLAFLDEVDAAISTILSTPEAFSKRRKDIRMFVLARFLFSLLYRVSQNRLEVLVVRHHARYEGYGMGRAYSAQQCAAAAGASVMRAGIGLRSMYR